MDDYPSNSRRPPLDPNTSKSMDEPQFEKIVTGKVIKRKKPLGRRIMDTFFSGDSNSVIGYLGREVLLPALQNLLTDFVTQGVEKAVYGEVRSSRTTGYRGTAPRTHVSYDRPGTTSYSRPAPAPARAIDRRPPQRHSDEQPEYVLEHRIQAEAVAEKLYDAVETYGVVSVAALNNLIGDTPQWTDHKFGWTDLSDMTIRRVREGYLLVMPPVEDIK